MHYTPIMEWAAPAAPPLPLFKERRLVDLIYDHRLADTDEGQTVIELAEREFPLVGVGGHASVFEHPDDDALVIRISDYPDGWFAYAAQVMDLQREHGLDSWMRFAPAVHEIAICDGAGIYAATVERLRHKDDRSSKRLIALARQARDVDRHSWRHRELLEYLEEDQPGIGRFMDFFWDALIDLHPGNMMFRGDTLIFNDPRGRPLTNYEIVNLEEHFGL